jgi:hypothetical protein
VKNILTRSLRSAILWTIAFFAPLFAGCGYHFAAEGSALPAQAKTIYVEKFSNHTRFTGINDEFMLVLKDQIADHKRLDLTDDPHAADLVLSGEVVYFDSMPGATNSVGEPILYLDSMSANAVLTDTHTHRVIWSTHGVNAGGQAPVVSSAVITTSPNFLQQNLRAQDISRLPDLQLAQTQRTATRDQIMEQLAQNLYASMTEGF